MAVDWGLADPSQGYDYLKSLQTIGQIQNQRAQTRLQGLQQGLQQRTFEAKQQEAARAQQVAASAGQMLDAGDINGARRAAISGGQIDLAGQIGGLSDDHVKQLANEAQVSGAIANHILSLPQEQWGAAYQAAAPALKQAGFSDQELQQFQLTPEALQAHAAAAQTVTQQIEAAQRNREQTFRENKVDFVPVPQGGFLQGVRADGTLFDGGQGGAPQQGQQPAQGDAGGTFGNMIQAESGGRQFTGNGTPVTSPKGAVGMAQVMPATGPEAAAAAGLPWDPQRFANDAQYNRALGEAYYAKQLATHNGDPTAAAAAYNAGPGRANRAGAPQTRGNWTQALPKETQAYIRKVAPGYASGGQSSAPTANQAPQQAGRIYGNPKPGYQLLSPQDAQAAGLDPNTHWQKSPDGQYSALPAKGDKPLTEGQSKATAYFSRAQLALQQLGAVKGAGPPGAMAQFADELPFGVGQHLIKDSDQQQLTARRAFIAAILRQESGAAISPSEFNSYNKLYFDQTGDTPQVRQNKAALRRSAVDALKIEAGPGADKLPGTQPSRQQPRAQQPARSGGGVARVSNASDYARLPSGAKYIDPQGNQRTKR